MPRVHDIFVVASDFRRRDVGALVNLPVKWLQPENPAATPSVVRRRVNALPRLPTAAFWPRSVLRVHSGPTRAAIGITVPGRSSAGFGAGSSLAGRAR